MNSPIKTAVQAFLVTREGGEADVLTPIGQVDLVTPKYVIQICHVNEWMNSIKILLYAKYFPDKLPRVHLFGKYSQENKDLIDSHLKRLSVLVTWENTPPCEETIDSDT